MAAVKTMASEAGSSDPATLPDLKVRPPKKSYLPESWCPLATARNAASLNA